VLPGDHLRGTFPGLPDLDVHITAAWPRPSDGPHLRFDRVDDSRG
jgi:hypothetical protein